MRRACCAVAALLALYVCGAAALYGLIRHYRGVSEARLIDALVPSRWPRFQAAQGDHSIAQAIRLVQLHRHGEALVFLRSGLAKSPAHRPGRLLLAQLLADAGRDDAARNVLLEGLAFHARDPAYLAPLCRLLLQRHDDAEVIALARRLLPSTLGVTAADRTLALAAATASFLRGNYDEMEDFLGHVPKLAESRDGRLLAAKADWERGHRQLALLRLRHLAAGSSGDAEIQTELCLRLRQAGLRDEARRASIAFQLAQPTLAAPRVAWLHALRESGETAALAAEVDALLRDFTDARTLLAVADFAAAGGDAALCRRLTAEAHRRDLPLAPHALLEAEALIVARDYRGAIEAMRALREGSAAPARQRALCDSLQAVAYFGLGELDTARLYLASFLHLPGLRAENLLALANRFAALGGAESARDILVRAVALDPANQPALARLIELELDLERVDELPARLQRLLTMRKPSPDLLRVAQHKLGSDRFLFSTERAAALDAVRLALERSQRDTVRF